MLTATFLSSYLPMLSTLLTVDLSIFNCILRGSTIEFQQRKIEMRFEICSKKAQFVGKGLLQVAEFLQRNLDSSIVIICNSRKQSQHIAVQLKMPGNNMLEHPLLFSSIPIYPSMVLLGLTRIIYKSTEAYSYRPVCQSPGKNITLSNAPRNISA